MSSGVVGYCDGHFCMVSHVFYTKGIRAVHTKNYICNDAKHA